MPPDPQTRPTGVFRALRHRNFRLFMAGQLVSLVGTWMQSVAQAWLVYRLTGSAVQLGMVAFASQVPMFVLAPFGGILADRVSRRRIVLWTQAASMVLAGILAFLTLAGLVQVWHLYVLGALLGATNAFDIPARQALLVELVGREDLPNAIGLNSSMFNGARLVGPAVAGGLVALVGEGWCFFGNAVSYLAVIAGLLAMRLTGPSLPRPEGNLLQHLAEGFRYALGVAPVRALILLMGTVALLGSPYMVLLPIFAEDILGGGANTLGFLMAASGAGALAGALLLAARQRLAGLGTWIALSCAGGGLTLVAFAESRSLVLSLLLMVPAGFCMMIHMAATNTLIQSMVPDQLRGRVMSVYSMFFMGMAPLGAAITGVLARELGAPTTVALGGALCVVAASVFWVRLPALRGEARHLVTALRARGAD